MPSKYVRAYCKGQKKFKSDFAKWMVDDPRVNFAISTRGRAAGLDHLGIQVEDKAELGDVYACLHLSLIHI